VRDRSWREIARQGLDTDQADALIATLSKEAPTVLGDEIFTPDLSAYMNTPLLRKDVPSAAKGEIINNEKLFLRYLSVRDQLFGELVELWPVQRAILRALYKQADEGKAISPGGSGKTVQQKWFEGTLKIWKDLMPQIKALLHQTQHHIQLGTPHGQLAATAAFLKKIDLPFDFLWSHYEHVRSLARKMEHIAFDSLGPKAQKAFQFGFACTPSELGRTLSALEAKEKALADARRAILEHNLKLVYGVIRKDFRTLTTSKKRELVTPGVEGLYRAVDLFQHTAGVRFETYAYPWIKKRISNYLRESSDLIVPAHYAEYRDQLSMVRARLCREPTLEEKVDYLKRLNNIDEELALRIITSIEARFVSADTSKPSDGDDYLASVAFVTKPPPPSDLRRNHQTRELLADALSTLDPREHQIISLLYGLAAHTGPNPGEIRFDEAHQDPKGRIFDNVAPLSGLSRSRVQQIEVEALRRLRESSSPRAARLRGYIKGELSVGSPRCNETGDPLSESPVSTLDILPRYKRALENSAVFTVGQVTALTVDEIRSIPTFGAGAVKSIRTALQRLGRTLRGDP
jgi:RNA polymerase sigma factor (sigma-70 family)